MHPSNPDLAPKPIVPADIDGPSLAVAATDVAKMLSISRAHVWRLLSSGRLPRPVRFGRSVRWDRGTIEKWLAAGAPPRDRWEASRPHKD